MSTVYNSRDLGRQTRFKKVDIASGEVVYNLFPNIDTDDVKADRGHAGRKRDADKAQTHDTYSSVGEVGRDFQNYLSLFLPQNPNLNRTKGLRRLQPVGELFVQLACCVVQLLEYGIFLCLNAPAFKFGDHVGINASQ